ncbi:MAG TPA: hypothetical protein VIU64_03505, partial [Polyangia bacterium]
MWEAFYDVRRLAEPARQLFARIEGAFPAFVERLLSHRPASLGGARLGDALGDDARRPERLAALYTEWGGRLRLMGQAPPTLTFAALGQARLDGRLSPERESELLAKLLRHWAWRSTVDVGEVCAAVRQRRLRDGPRFTDRPAAHFAPPALVA